MTDDNGDRIEGKVASILTARELVINKGSEDGVEVGMRFAVLNRKGNEILDPDTNEALGSVELPKTFVKVISVEPRLAIAKTFREFVTPAVQGIFGSLGSGSLMSGSPERRVAETLKTDEARLKDELDEAESYVKRGDPVVQIIKGQNYVGLD